MVDLKNLKKHVVNSSPRDKIFLYHGAPGTRKTTVATGEPETTILAAYEIGYKFIPNVYAVNLSNWHGFKDLVRQLADEEIKQRFKTVAIDTVGLAYKACIAYICALHGVAEIGKIPFGQGYTFAKNEFERVLGTISQLGYGLVMIAHSDELNDEKNGISIKVDIDKRPSSVIKGMADFILYARKELKEGSEDEMTVYAYSESKNPNIEVKSRARFFPKKIEFTYENIMAGLAEAIRKQDEFYKTKSIEKANFEVYQETEVNLPALQNDVKALANRLVQLGRADDVTKILTEHLKGVRVGETNKTHIPSLYAVRDELMDLEKKL